MIIAIKRNRPVCLHLGLAHKMGIFSSNSEKSRIIFPLLPKSISLQRTIHYKGNFKFYSEVELTPYQ